MALEIVKLRKDNINLPSIEAVNKGIELALLDKTGESADYLLSQVEKRLKNAGSSAQSNYVGVLDTLHKLIQYVKSAFSGGDSWSGIAPLQGFQNFQNKLAEDSAAKIDAEKQIQFDFAVSDNANLVRAYSTNGELLDDVTTESIDNLLNAWLAKNQMVNTGGVVYKASMNGKALQDSSGNLERADPLVLRSRMIDKEHGFESYIHKMNSEVKISANLRSYGEGQQAEQQPDVVSQNPGGA